MIKRVLGGAAAAALGLAGLAVTATAQAKATHGSATVHAIPGLHTINLRSAYERALPHAHAGKISGIIYARGHQPAAAPRAPSTCAEPNCPLVYHGGPVQHSPHLYLLLWGPNWQKDSSQAASATYLEHFLEGLGVQPADTWSATTSQYSDATGFPTFSGSVFAGVYNDTTTPPTGTSDAQFAAEADAFASANGLTSNPVDDQVIIATQSGTCPAGFYAKGCYGGTGNYCAYHDYSTVSHVTFTNLPYVIDSGTGCGQDIISNGTNSAYDGFSIIEGHEYAETITDPQAGNGWIDNNDNSGGEIGDKCAWEYPGTSTSDIHLVTLSTGAFAMQPLFSNSAFAAGKQSCPMSTSPDTLTVSSPGSQSFSLDLNVRLQIKATSSTGAKRYFTATGLPAGLAINPFTGLITGTTTASTGSAVTVTVSDTTGAATPVSFGWDISGQIKGYKGKCVDDYLSSTASGTKIILRYCGSARGELWAPGPNRSLQFDGKCLTDRRYGRAGSKVYLEACHGLSTQHWTHRFNGEWVLKFRGLCLTDPRYSTTNGTQLIVAACRDHANQKWSKI